MKIHRIALLAIVLFGWGTLDLYSQSPQTIKANFVNGNSGACISLKHETSLVVADILESEVLLYTLPAGDNGFLEVFVDDIAYTHFKLSLEEENNGAIYLLEVDNLTITVGGNTFDLSSHDVLRIQRCSNTIKFYNNDELLHTQTISSNAIALNARLNVLSISTNSSLPPPFVYLSFPNVTTGCPSPPNRENYLHLQKRLDASYFILTDDQLRFSYEEDYAITTGQNDQVTYRIYNAENPQVTNLSGTLTNVYGINWQALNIATIGSGVYVLELSNVSKGETYYLRFKYNNDGLSN